MALLTEAGLLGREEDTIACDLGAQTTDGVARLELISIKTRTQARAMREVVANEFVVAGTVAIGESLGILLGHHETLGREQERVVEDAGDLERGSDLDLLADIVVPMEGEGIEGDAYGASHARQAYKRQKEYGNGAFHDLGFMISNL